LTRHQQKNHGMFPPPSNTLFSSPQQQQPFAGFGSPQDTGGSMFGQYPCKMCDKRFTTSSLLTKHQQKNQHHYI